VSPTFAPVVPGTVAAAQVAPIVTALLAAAATSDEGLSEAERYGVRSLLGMVLGLTDTDGQSGRCGFTVLAPAHRDTI
jgi:hypothetical protein